MHFNYGCKNNINSLKKDLIPLDHIPTQRLEVLKRGVHVNRPFVGYALSRNNFDPLKADKEFGDDEIAIISSLGFKHIRLSIAIRDFYNEEQPEQLNKVFLAALTILICII